MAQLAVGTELAGRFRLERLLGRGGSAEVWAAADRTTGTEVALRVLTALDAPSAAVLVADLQNDVARLRRLAHPGILRPLAVVADGTLAAVAVELADAGDLGALRGAGHQAIVAAIREVADALQYVHAQGLTHGDLKAGNVLRDRQGRWRLTDFRGSTQLEPHTAVSLSTISPQQLDGAPPTVADDIYSLGAVLYDLLSGYPPLHPGITAERIRSEVPTRLGVDGQGQPVPIALTQLVGAMLEKTPGRRPGSLGVVRALLAEIVTESDRQPGWPAAAVPGGEIPPQRRARAAAGWPPVLLVGGFSALLAGVVAVVFWLPRVVSERGPLVRPALLAPARPAAVAESKPPPAPDTAETSLAETALAETTQAQADLAERLRAEDAAKAADVRRHQQDEARRTGAETAARAASNFERAMAEGLAALAAGRLPEARSALDRALALRPGDAGARNALEQVVGDERRGRLTGLQNEAERLAAAERWSEALDQYRAMLNLDATLAAAQTGLATAEVRAALHLQLEQLLTKGDRFNDDTIVAGAQSVISEAEAVTGKGPVLTRQIAQLKSLLAAASEPVAVQFESDNLTSIVIYKVGSIGAFSSRTIDLRPGSYVIVGTRDGYRDVRRTVRIDATGSRAPIDVRCEEPI